MKKIVIMFLLIFSTFTIGISSNVQAREVINTHVDDHYMVSVGIGILVENVEWHYSWWWGEYATWDLYSDDPSPDNYTIFQCNECGDIVLISGWVNIEIQYYILGGNLTPVYNTSFENVTFSYFEVNEGASVQYTTSPTLPGMYFPPLYR